MGERIWVVLLLVTVTLQLYRASEANLMKNRIPCPRPYCVCVRTCAVCNGTSVYIPRLPRTVNHVTFRQTNLPNITSILLTNLTLNVINRLDFCNTNTTDIAPDAFVAFTNLTHLEISNNDKLRPGVISLVLNRTRHLDTVKLESNTWHTLPTSMFFGLKNSAVKIISLRNNDIETIGGSHFTNMSSLSELDLSGNELTHLNGSGFESTGIRKLRISNNNMQRMPTLCGTSGKPTGKFEYIDVSSNPIFILNQSSFQCLLSLQTLYLNGLSLRSLKDNTFSSLPHLSKLTFSRNGDHLKSIDPLAFNSSSLQSLLFANNHFRFDRIPFQYSNIFRYLPRLISLELTNNQLPSDSTSLRNMFSPLKRLQRLILSSTKLKFVPLDVFQHIPKLTELVLSGNYLSGWNDDPAVFGNITSIKRLYLDGNNIKLINKTSFPEHFLHSLDKICLTNNPYSCTCDLKWFLDWMKSSQNTTIVNYPRRYTCRYPPEMNNVLLKNYNPTKEMCSNLNKLIQDVCIVLSAGFIVAVLLVSLGYRYRFYVKYWLHVTGIRKLGYHVLQDDTDYQYDAFVIYSDDDEAFVIENILPELEKKAKCRLCIKSRDFDIGGLIIDNISRKFEVSRNIILVLSKAFLDSEWCGYQLALAQTKAVCEGPGVLAVVLLEEMEPAMLSASIRALLQTGQICKWSDDEPGLRRFWGQLLTSLNKHTHLEEDL